MTRRKPDPQDRRVQLNASIPLRVKDELDERAENAGVSASSLVTAILMEKFGMA